MGVVGVLDLARGTLADFVTCPFRQHDIKGFYELREHFRAGDIAIGDRAFCSYERMGLLKAGEVDSVMRLHQRRDAKRDWKSGKHIDSSSRLVLWQKPPKKGKAGLSDEEWEALPSTMELRLVKVRGMGDATASHELFTWSRHFSTRGTIRARNSQQSTTSVGPSK